MDFESRLLKPSRHRMLEPREERICDAGPHGGWQRRGSGRIDHLAATEVQRPDILPVCGDSDRDHAGRRRSPLSAIYENGFPVKAPSVYPRALPALLTMPCS